MFSLSEKLSQLELMLANKAEEKLTRAEFDFLRLQLSWLIPEAKLLEMLLPPMIIKKCQGPNSAQKNIIDTMEVSCVRLQ